MDQVKEYLKLAVKYRFWIVVFVAALMPIIGYTVAAGPMETLAKTKTDAIKSSEGNVKAIQNGLVTNAKWTQLANEKTTALTGDVNRSWSQLYSRQAPLLDWPAEVEDTFRTWGDQWPKDVDKSQVDRVINIYAQVYPDYVSKVYESFHPWNPETGQGIVVSVPKEALLKPAEFSITYPSTLSRVHVAQKRLWIQRTMLDVVRAVNEKAGAKDWETARVKQITALEVASAAAQDQKSAAKGEALEAPPEITEPGTPVAAPAPGSGPASSGPKDPNRTGTAADGGTIEFIKSPAPDQYFVVPVSLGVLIDQDHIADLLVEFENSPMSIQVADVDWERPGARVQRPVVGQDQSFNSFNRMGGSETILGVHGPGGDRGPLPGSGPRSFTVTAVSPSLRKGGKDVSSENLEKIRQREDAKKKGGAPKKADPSVPSNTLADPFFNLVEVHIYGQARFYRKPPADATPPPATSTAPAPTPATAPTPAEAPKAEPPKAEAPKDALKDASKTEEPKAAPGEEASKKAEPGPAAGAPAPKPGDAPPASTPPAGEPKKEDGPKGDPAKGEPSKDAPKP